MTQPVSEAKEAEENSPLNPLVMNGPIVSIWMSPVSFF